MKLLIIICWDYLPAINKKKNFIIIYNLFNECHMFNINIMFIVFFFFVFCNVTECVQSTYVFLCWGLRQTGFWWLPKLSKTQQYIQYYTLYKTSVRWHHVECSCVRYHRRRRGVYYYNMNKSSLLSVTISGPTVGFVD